MTGTGLLAATRIILLCLTAYFGVAYSIVKALEMFTVYIPFSGAMADGGVYSRQDHRRLLTGHSHLQYHNLFPVQKSSHKVLLFWIPCLRFLNKGMP